MGMIAIIQCTELCPPKHLGPDYFSIKLVRAIWVKSAYDHRTIMKCFGLFAFWQMEKVETTPIKINTWKEPGYKSLPL